MLVSRLDKLLEIRLFYRIRLVQAQIVQVRFLPSHRGLKEMRGMMKDLIKGIARKLIKADELSEKEINKIKSEEYVQKIRHQAMIIEAGIA